MTFVYEISEPRRLGRALREERRRQGLTQTDLAGRAQVSRGWLIRLEAGHGTAEMDTVFRVIAALGLTVTLAPSQDTPEDRAAQSAFESIFDD
jgi:HTH-type transcriptional regulator/antitoxin HipB